MLELYTRKLLSFFVKKSFQSDSVLHGIDKLDQIVPENQCFKCLEVDRTLVLIQRRAICYKIICCSNKSLKRRSYRCVGDRAYQ
jgi:flagellar biosynthesis regulator FlbT